MECVREARVETQVTTVGLSNLQIIKDYNKEAFKFINEGLNLEDREKTSEAKVCYEKGLRSIEAALKLPKDLSQMNFTDEKEYQSIIEKLKKAEVQVRLRLEAVNGLAEQVNGTVTASAPPLAEANDIPDTTANESPETDTWQDVKELVSIKEGVNLFHVDGKGEVSPWTSPCALEIFQILKQGFEKVSPPAFMKCGEWIYPMEPGQSPVLKTKNRTYMFPDVTVEQDSASGTTQMPSIGVVLSDLVPDSLVSRFERILSCYADFRKDIEKQVKEKPLRPPPPAIKSKGEQPKANGHIEQIIAKPALVENREVAEPNPNNQMVEKAPLADRISEGISVGSQWVSWGLVKGAEYTSALVGRSANSLRERIQPKDEPVSVDPEVSHNIRQIQQATGSVVQISAFLVGALGTMTYNIGKKVAPHVIYQGQKLLPDKYKLENSESSQKKFEDAKKVAAAGLEGFGLVFLSLEQAGKNLYQAVSNATVQTLQHKYGVEVGDVSQDAMGAAGNAVMAYWNLQKLGPNEKYFSIVWELHHVLVEYISLANLAIAKRAVKDTGKAMLLEDNNTAGKLQ